MRVLHSNILKKYTKPFISEVSSGFRFVIFAICNERMTFCGGQISSTFFIITKFICWRYKADLHGYQCRICTNMNDTSGIRTRPEGRDCISLNAFIQREFSYPQVVIHSRLNWWLCNWLSSFISELDRLGLLEWLLPVEGQQTNRLWVLLLIMQILMNHLNNIATNDNKLIVLVYF